VEEGVIHSCVPNLTATVARTTSYAITNAALPYLLAVGEHGLLGSYKVMPSLLAGINLYQGELVHPDVAAAMGRAMDSDLLAKYMTGNNTGQGK